MKISNKGLVYSLIIALAMFMFSSCATTNQGTYKDGYYVLTIPGSFDEVYGYTEAAIENGQTYDKQGNPYKIVQNQSENGKAFIQGVSTSDSSDNVQFIIEKVNDNTSKLFVKYGKNGDSIRASAIASAIADEVPAAKKHN